MPQVSGSPDKTFGYLSTIATPEHGYFGGYLIVSPLGRPVEFHCTAPIRPNRAQQILYGPTLEPYLLGEQICGALLETAKLKPCVIVTDSEAAMHARVKCPVPIALLLKADASCTDFAESHSLADEIAAVGREFEISPLKSRSPSGEIAIGIYRLRLPPGFERDETDVLDSLKLLTERVQLAEPFARIHEAIREAQRIGSGTDANEQAA